MGRLAVLASVFVVLAGLVVYARGNTATATQDATPAATANHPVVGGWRWENETPEGTFVSYAVFHPDGTYVEATPDGVLIGVWRATGERTADVTFFAADLDPDPDVTVSGEGRMAAEVDETGNAMTAPFTFEARDAEGTVVFAGELMSRGTRLAVAPMVPLGTPTAATPTS